jgi:hypothetical protein
MRACHEHTPRGGGLARVAGQSCLAGPSVLRLHPSFGYGHAWCMLGSHADRVKLFSPTADIFLSPTSTMLMPRALLHTVSAACGSLPAAAAPTRVKNCRRVHWVLMSSPPLQLSKLCMQGLMGTMFMIPLSGVRIQSEPAWPQTGRPMAPVVFSWQGFYTASPSFSSRRVSLR